MRPAADRRYLDIIKFLSEIGVDVWSQTEYILYSASANGDYPMVKYVLENGQPCEYITALQNASGNGHLEIVKLLVEKGADIHYSDEIALRFAAEEGHTNIVKYLVEIGADIHARSDYALRFACERGDTDLITYLIKIGANVNAQNDYALRTSSFKGYYQIVVLLVEHGAKICEASFKNAAENGHVEIVQYFIDKGTDVAIGNNAAIKSAYRSRCMDVVKLLAKHGADTSCLNSVERSSLFD